MKMCNLTRHQTLKGNDYTLSGRQSPAFVPNQLMLICCFLHFLSFSNQSAVSHWYTGRKQLVFSQRLVVLLSQKYFLHGPLGGATHCHNCHREANILFFFLFFLIGGFLSGPLDWESRCLHTYRKSFTCCGLELGATEVSRLCKNFRWKFLWDHFPDH